MKAYIKLSDFLESKNINFKDSSRLELEEKWKKEEYERQKRVEYRNKLENYKRPKEELKVGDIRNTILEEGKYKNLEYRIILTEDYYDADQYFLEIETKNTIYNEPFNCIEKLRELQESILEKYSKMPERPGIFDIYIGSCEDNIIIEDMKEYQDILKYNERKYNTTYKIRAELLKLKFKWDPNKRHWKLEISNKEKREELINSLRKKYCNEYAEKELRGIKHCWECGCAYHNKHECM